MVKCIEILVRCPGDPLGRPVLGFELVQPLRIGRDDRRINAELLARDEALGDAAGENGFEEMAKEIAVAESSLSVLREG